MAQVFAVDRLGHLLAGVDGRGAAPVAWLQLAGYTELTGAFDRWTSPLAAVREAAVVAAVLTAGLLWVLARRFALTPWAATAALTLLAVAPLAVGIGRVVLPENLALPWALAALLLCSHPRPHPSRDLMAVACLVIAVLTAPSALLLAPVAAWLVLRRESPRWVAGLGLLTLAAVSFTLGPDVLLARLLSSADAGIGAWIALDPVLLAAIAVAALAALLVAELRPLAVSTMPMLAVLALPGTPRLGVLAMLVPFGCVLIAGVISAATRVRFRAPQRLGRGKHGTLRPLAPWAGAFTALLVVGTIPFWVTGLSALRSHDGDDYALAQAQQWLAVNLPGTPVRSDELTWVRLAGTGRHVEPCESDCEWTVSTPALRPVETTSAVAVFGSGPQRVEIRRATPSVSVGAGEVRARVGAGAALLGSSQVTVDPDQAELLRTGAVDPRVLATVAALAATKPVRVTDFPAVPGEDAAGQPRRQLLLAAAGEPADQLLTFFAGQRGVFHPESATATTDGVLVRFAPGAPAGLLTPFDTP